MMSNGSSQQRFRLTISDGLEKVQAMPTTQINSIIADLKDNAIICLDSATAQTANGNL